MKIPKTAIFLLVAVVLLVGSLLGACGSPSPTGTATPTTPAATTPTTPASPTATGTTPATPTQTTPAAPKPEGTFTFGVSSLQTEGFVPWITFLSDYLVYGPVYDYIALESPAGENLPCVAESWEFSEDYRDLTIHVRKGIQFHDGWGEVTAEDVAYLLDQMRSEASTSGVKAFTEIIESIEIVDPYTLIVHQSVPNVDNADSYAFSPPYCPVLSKKYVESVGAAEANINPIGSGPYKLIEKKTGNYLKYEAVENHWRVVPEFKYLVIQQVPEESTRIAMLKTGAIDATVISPASLPDLEGEEDFTVETWPGGAISAIIFGGLSRPDASQYKEGYHNQDPWRDIRVREAMNIAIDRDAINQALHYGTATPVSTNLGLPGYQEIPPYPYDPDRARELLAEAAADGVFTPNSQGGFSMTLVSSPFHPGVPMIAKEAEAVAGFWDEIGIQVEINPLDFGAYYMRTTLIETAGECFTYRNLWGGPNPYTQLLTLDKTAGWGFMYQCEEADIWTPMCQEALAEFDLDKRTEMYKEICQFVVDSYTTVPLLQVPYIIAKNNKKVGDLTPNNSSYYYNFEYIRHKDPLNTFRLFELE